MHRNVVLPSRRRGRVRRRRRRRRRRRHSLRHHHHHNRFIVVEYSFMLSKNSKRVKRSLSFYLQCVMNGIVTERGRAESALFSKKKLKRRQASERARCERVW